MCCLVCTWRVEAAGWGFIWVKVVWRNERPVVAQFLPLSLCGPPSPPPLLSWPHIHFLHVSSVPLSVLFSFLICLNLSMERPPLPLPPLSHATSLNPSMSPSLTPPMLFQCCCLSLSNNCTPVRAQWVLLQTHPERHTYTHTHTRANTHSHACKRIPTLTHAGSSSS